MIIVITIIAYIFTLSIVYLKKYFKITETVKLKTFHGFFLSYSSMSIT